MLPMPPAPQVSGEPLAAAPRPPLVATIESVGSYLPAAVLSNAEMEALVETSDTWIMERTGIRERRRAGSGETASEMGAAAARQALERAGNPEIDVIIAATCSGDTRFPSTACMIQRKLGLHGQAAFDVGAVCSGWVYAMSVADAMVRSGAARRILVVATEAMTTLVDYRDRGTCVLFGDGAAATLVAAGDTGGVRAVRTGADGGEGELIFYGPPDDDAQGEARIRMAGKGTYRLAVERLCNMAAMLCADAGWELDDVDLFVPHQANARIIEAAAKRLEVPMDRVFVNVDRYGNTSAATIPLALADAVDEGRLRPGSRVISVAFGAGATWGGVALEWTAAPSR